MLAAIGADRFDVQTFGHAGTDLGRAAGCDLLICSRPLEPLIPFLPQVRAEMLAALRAPPPRVPVATRPQSGSK